MKTFSKRFIRKALNKGVFLYGVEEPVTVGASADLSILVVNDKKKIASGEDRFLRPEDYGLTFSLKPF